MFWRGFPIAAALVSFIAAAIGSVSTANAQIDASPAPSPLPSASPSAKPERFSFHLQSTDTQQYHGGFRAPYSGLQSLDPKPDTAKTIAADVFLGARLWENGEFYVNPELDQGFGLGHPSPPGTPYYGTIGAAGYFSGEDYKVGRDSSYGRIQRAFVRQTVDLGGGEAQKIDPDINQLGGSITPKNLIVTAGKFSVTDVFDSNPYAHDPANDFLNWAIIDMGSFDYAADAWGFTYGASAELSDEESTLRAGLFQLSLMPNVIAIESVPFRQYSPIVEFERRTSFLGGRPSTGTTAIWGRMRTP